MPRSRRCCGRCQTVSGSIVRLERLRLECEENGDPLVALRKVDEERPVLEYAVIFDELLSRIPLVHVDVVDAQSGRKTERGILLVLRTEARSEPRRGCP